MQQNQTVFFSVKDVTKSFPGVLALNHVSLDVKYWRSTKDAKSKMGYSGNR